jgi:hypothetical protein
LKKGKSNYIVYEGGIMRMKRIDEYGYEEI